MAPVGYLVRSLLVVLFIVSFVPIIVFFLILKAVSKLYSLIGIKILPQWLEQRVETAREVVRVTQTTHGTDVNNAVNVNVQELRKSYGEPDVEDESITQIEDFINQMEYVANNAQKDINKNQLTESEKKHALDCLQRIKDNTDQHNGSGLTVKQLLTLVWKACNDRDKKSADPNVNINTRISQRKHQLVKQLIESQTEYGIHNDRGANACFTGTFNSIISSLYAFGEFSFLQKLDKDIVRVIFKDELQKRGEELLNQLSNDDDKKAVAGALSHVSVISFILEYTESFKKHSARAVLGDEECNKLVKDHLENLQYSKVVSPFVS